MRLEDIGGGAWRELLDPAAQARLRGLDWLEQGRGGRYGEEVSKRGYTCPYPLGFTEPPKD